MVFGEETPEESKWFEEGGGSKRSFDTTSEKPDNAKAKKEAISVYPNPASDKIIVEYDIDEKAVGVKFYLFNLLGNRIIERIIDPGVNKTEISLSEVPDGIYIYKVDIQ